MKIHAILQSLLIFGCSYLLSSCAIDGFDRAPIVSIDQSEQFFQTIDNPTAAPQKAPQTTEEIPAETQIHEDTMSYSRYIGDSHPTRMIKTISKSDVEKSTPTTSKPHKETKVESHIAKESKIKPHKSPVIKSPAKASKIDKPAEKPEAKAIKTWLSPIRNHSAVNDSLKGVDIQARFGQEVLAARDGEVIFAGNDPKVKAYGNLIIIRHEDNFISVYAYNKSIDVNVGDKVFAGQTIARVGYIPNTKTSGLHFEIRQNGKAINVNKLLNFKG